MASDLLFLCEGGRVPSPSQRGLRALQVVGDGGAEVAALRISVLERLDQLACAYPENRAGP